MKNKITVSIAGQEYTMVAEEAESYVKRCAELVDAQVRGVMNGGHLGRSDAAVLAAMNVADKYCKERAVSDNLRAQLKQALDENARLARELSETKREGRKASRGGRPPKQPPAEPSKPAGEEG